MKYIKTKDGVYEVEKKERAYFEGQPWLYYCKRKSHLVEEKDVLKQADTIDELIDEKVLIEKDGHPTLLETVEFDRHIYLRINEYEFATQLPGNPIIHGSIWIYDSNGSPTLKPVAKMKCVLPNGEIDWELL